MKCPKCNYMSFDYNQVCPKCNKDISAEQQKMNLPTYKPSPPFLLGSLMGEADHAKEEVFSKEAGLDFALELEGNTERKEPERPAAPADLTETEFLVEGEEEVEHLEPLSDFEFEAGGKETALGPKEISPQNLERPSNLSSDEKEIFLDLDDLSMKESETGKDSTGDDTLEQDEEELGIDLEDLSLDEIEPQREDAHKEVSLDRSEMVTLVIDKEEAKTSTGIEETELDLELERLQDE